MELNEFNQCLKPYQAIMGVDFGTKRLGIAVSDLLRTIASSYKIIERKNWENDILQIKNIIKEKQIGAIIYGLPLQMNGQEGEIASKVREFADKVHKETSLPYMFWDERLSSSAVENFLIKEVDLSRSKRKKVLDASAAAYILQGALDRLQYL